MVYLILFSVPALVALFIYLILHKSITGTELTIQMAATALIAGLCAGAVSCQNTADTEFLNSSLVDKQQVRVSCSHSYECNCYETCSTDSKGNQSCTRHCSTCYEHSNDYDWTLFSSMHGWEIDIERVDRQGVREPKRFTIAKVGDPMTFHHDYENFIKAAPGTLFRHQGLEEKYAGKLPPYPMGIYDYHYSSKIVNLSSLPIGASWQLKLDKLNSHIGFKQSNLIIVVVEDKPQDYAYALEQHWVGGKKNDTTVIVSVQKNWSIQWVHVMSWTSNELFKVKLRDDINKVGTLDLNTLFPIIESDIVQYYKRKPMHDFEYLASTIKPTSTQWTVCLILVTLITIGLSCLFAHPDVDIVLFGHSRGYRKRYW